MEVIQKLISLSEGGGVACPQVFKVLWWRLTTFCAARRRWYLWFYWNVQCLHGQETVPISPQVSLVSSQKPLGRNTKITSMTLVAETKNRSSHFLSWLSVEAEKTKKKRWRWTDEELKTCRRYRGEARSIHWPLEELRSWKKPNQQKENKFSLFNIIDASFIE